MKKETTELLIILKLKGFFTTIIYPNAKKHNKINHLTIVIKKSQQKMAIFS